MGSLVFIKKHLIKKKNLKTYFTFDKQYNMQNADIKRQNNLLFILLSLIP